MVLEAIIPKYCEKSVNIQRFSKISKETQRYRCQDYKKTFFFFL
jgi:transposase-like protein